MAALQHLPPRQRAVLILREVLRWKADEVAQLLDTTVASVNSALQRARATLAEHGGAPEPPRRSTPTTASCSPGTSTRSSATTSTRSSALLHEDATQHMPPFEMWLRGARRHRHLDARPGRGLPRVAGGRRFEANGSPGVRAVAAGGPAAGTSRGRCTCWRSTDGRIAHISSFLDLDNGLFARLGLPATLPSGR